MTGHTAVPMLEQANPVGIRSSKSRRILGMRREATWETETRPRICVPDRALHPASVSPIIANAGEVTEGRISNMAILLSRVPPLLAVLLATSSIVNVSWGQPPAKPKG